jgi:serine/threonine-protein kinase
MAKEPGRRYTNCRDLLAAARAALTAQPAATPLPIAAPPPSGPQHTAGQHAAAQSSQQGRGPGLGPYAAAPGFHQQPPMRLRDPLPAQTTAFDNTGTSNWLLPALLGAALVGVVVLILVLVLSDGGDGGTPSTPSSTPSSTGPSVNVPSSTGRPLPSVIPTVTR